METMSIKSLLELASAKAKIVFSVFLASLGLILWNLLVSTPGLLLPEQVANWAVAICLISGCFLLATFIWNTLHFFWAKRLRPWMRRRRAEELKRKNVETLRLNLLTVGLPELAQLSNARTLQNRSLHLNPDSKVCRSLAQLNLIRRIPWMGRRQYGANFEINEDAWELIQEMDEFAAENPQWLMNRFDATEIKNFVGFLPQSHPSVISFNSSSSTASD